MTEVRDVEYSAEGVTMRGRMAVPDGPGPFPGVLVAHEANGLDDHQAGRPEALAALGYAALAIDYHGDRTVVWTQAEMQPRLEAFAADVDMLRARVSAGLDVLVADERVDRGRVAAIGFCFGATAIMELARSGADLRAIVGFHPGLDTLGDPADSRRIRARVLMCVGDLDPLVPAERRRAWTEEMTAAGVDWQLNVYAGASHSFTHPRSERTGIPGLAYHRPTAERSWRAMVDLLSDTLT